MTEKTQNKTARLLVWIKELRAPFFTAIIVPVFLGTVVARYSFGVFYPAYFVLCLIGAVFMQAGTNVVNDYFDYKSGCDSADAEFVSPFSGGSGLIPRGVLDPRKVHIAALIFLALGGVIGIFLALARGWVILVLGVVGVVCGYFYTTQFAPRGVGEFIVGLNFGPLVVLGSFTCKHKLSL